MTPTLKAAIWMLGAITSFSTMAVAGREISTRHDTFEIMMYRSFVGLLIVVLVLSATGRWGQVSRQLLGIHVIRNIMHFTGQNLWLFAVTAIPLAQVFALEFTTPIWVLVLSPLILGESLTRPRALAALVGFAGILIVARPSPETINVGVLAATASAIFFAMTIMLTKKLTRTQSVASILLWLTVIQAVLGVAVAGHDGQIALPDAESAPWLVLIGLAGLLAHFCIANALSIAPASVVVPFDFARLPTIAVVGMLLYDEALDIWVLIGGAVILLAIYINILSETRRNRVA